MNNIVITLSGAIRSSNFDDWKGSLIEKINSVNLNLVTDDDFHISVQQSKSFKIAEKALKDAKQSAISQAEVL